MKNTRARKIAAKKPAPPTFEEIFTFDHLFESYQKSIKGVKWKNGTQKFRLNVIRNLLKIQNDLLNGTFRSKGFYEFDIVERGKPPAHQERSYQRANRPTLLMRLRACSCFVPVSYLR